MVDRHFRVFFVYYIAAVFLFLMVPFNLSADNRFDEEMLKGRSPSGLISIDSKHAIVVEKSSQQLFLCRDNGGGIEVLSRYQCSTGKTHGDKLKSGDRKTPEGVYFIKKIFNDENLPSRYGVMAFVLDFPNLLDRAVKKSGNGIWIHGLDRPIQPYDSKGCIALKNEDIKELKPYLRIAETPVIVEEKVIFEDSRKRSRIKNEIECFLTRWEDSWQQKDIDKYFKCYDASRFKPDKWSWNKWKEHKQSLNNRYKFIDVGICNSNIVEQGGTMVVSFFQDYESDRFRSSGYKKLFLQRNSDELKIIGEDWTKSGKEGNVSSEERILVRFLNRWILSWENKNIDLYMSCYSKKFSSRNMDWKEWKSYKVKANKANKTIKVFVGRTKTEINDSKAEVTFIQKYVSDNYTDYGLKKLKIQREEGSWKILAEEWESI